MPTHDCETAGTFDAVTQQCSASTVKADGTTCDSETTDEFGATLEHIYESIITTKFHAAPKHKRWVLKRLTLQMTRTNKWFQI